MRNIPLKNSPRNYQMLLGKSIREIRIEKKLSQADLAKDLCSRGAIAALECGEVLNPSCNLIFGICDRLGISITELLGRYFDDEENNFDLWQYFEMKIYMLPKEEGYFKLKNYFASMQPCSYHEQLLLFYQARMLVEQKEYDSAQLIIEQMKQKYGYERYKEISSLMELRCSVLQTLIETTKNNFHFSTNDFYEVAKTDYRFLINQYINFISNQKSIVNIATFICAIMEATELCRKIGDFYSGLTLITNAEEISRKTSFYDCYGMIKLSKGQLIYECVNNKILAKKEFSLAYKFARATSDIILGNLTNRSLFNMFEITQKGDIKS